MNKQKRQSIIEEAIGQPFNKLKVLRFVEFRFTPSRRAKVPMVECECECGNKKVISLWDVKSGKTKTCGVKANHLRYEDRSEPAFNSIYNHSYRNRALKAGLEFDLSKEQFRELARKLCHYCGSPPRATSYRGRRGVFKTGKAMSQFVYNGLDRIDSAKGYTLDNVVPCCGICNHAKHTMSYSDFTAWLDQIAAFRNVALTRAKQEMVLLSDAGGEEPAPEPGLALAGGGR